MKKLSLALFIISFLLLRPNMMQNNGLWYSDDDYGYFAHASSIVYGQFPSYEKEFFTDAEHMPLGSVGSGVLAAPFVAAFSLIDRIQGSDIVVMRTQQSIEKSWSQFGFIFATVFYFCLANFLLLSGLKLYVSRNFAFLAIIFCNLGQGIPLYIYRRPIFSNGYEFFMQSVMVFLLMYIYHKRETIKPMWWMSAGIGILSSFIFLIRYNNIFMAGLWPLILIWILTKGKLSIFGKL